MRNFFLHFWVLLFSAAAFSQAGHIMQGVGAINMSMGGASTGQPLDISGALHWNPAAITEFEGESIKFDLGLFFSSPELSSTAPILTNLECLLEVSPAELPKMTEEFRLYHHWLWFGVRKTASTNLELPHLELADSG